MKICNGINAYTGELEEVKYFPDDFSGLGNPGKITAINCSSTSQFGIFPGWSYGIQQESELAKSNNQFLENMETAIKTNLSQMLESIGKWPHHYEDCINEYTEKLMKDLREASKV